MLKTTPKLTLGSVYGIETKLLIKLLPESASPAQAVPEDTVSVFSLGHPSAFLGPFHTPSSGHHTASSTDGHQQGRGGFVRNSPERVTPTGKGEEETLSSSVQWMMSGVRNKNRTTGQQAVERERKAPLQLSGKGVVCFSGH